MDNFNALSPHEAIQLVRALHVERISQRQREDFLRRHFQMLRQRRLRSYSDVQIMPACDETVREID
jgi:hypothetical protein